MIDPHVEPHSAFEVRVVGALICLGRQVVTNARTSSEADGRSGLRTVQRVSRRQFWGICHSGCIFALRLVVIAVCTRAGRGR